MSMVATGPTLELVIEFKFPSTVERRDRLLDSHVHVALLQILIQFALKVHVVPSGC
jgi:hypothetical protein